MKPQFLCVTVTATSFILLCLLRCSCSQIVGCDAPNIDCPTKENAADGDFCAEDNGNIGVVSFNSNFSSSGPLTWTMTQDNDKGGNSLPPYAYRSFWLGTPRELSLHTVTNYAACTMILTNVSMALQTPADFQDFDNFGCPTVLGDECTSDILSRVREEMISVLDEGFPDYNPNFRNSPCTSVLKRISGEPLPQTCNLNLPVQQNVFQFGTPHTLTNNTEGVGFFYQDQKGCSMTTGGPGYRVFFATEENSYYYLDDDADLESEDIQRFKNGTTPILTFFYNEPWDISTTGPAPFLTGPEAHLHCLRTLPSTSEEYRSLSPRLHLRSIDIWLLAGFACSLIWS